MRQVFSVLRDLVTESSFIAVLLCKPSVLAMRHNTIIITLAVFCMLTSAEITIREFEEATALHDKCKTVCPMQEARVCAIDSISFRLHVFLNKCFMWGYNKCKNKEFSVLKSKYWCKRSKLFEEEQQLADRMMFNAQNSEFTHRNIVNA